MNAKTYPRLLLSFVLFVMVVSATGQTVQIAGVLPALGPVAGGTAVVITGAGFQSGATVSFGSVAAASVNVLSARAIAVVTPANGSGLVDVVVTNPDLTSATLPQGFLYACISDEAFKPVALTPGSFTYEMVVPASYPVLPAQAAVTVTMDGGPNKNGNTWYEIGTDLAAPNTGMPPAGGMLTDQFLPDHVFQLPPTWGGNNCLLIGNYPGAGLATGSFTPTVPATYSSLSFLNSSGNGPANLVCVVSHADGTSETSSFTSLDWFNSANAAFSAMGRLSLNGNGSFGNVGSPNGCKLFSTDVVLANITSPVTNISFTSVSGGRACIFAVSGSTGTGYAPIAVTGYNADIVIEATQLPLPYTATMDNGRNIGNGGGNTWYEVGWDPLAPTTGFPPHDSILSAYNTGTPFQMAGSYTNAMSTFVDLTHQTVMITPATPQPYNALSFLTSGGSIGAGRTMASQILVQYADGTAEPHLFFQSDWFEGSVPWAYAANGRVNFSNGRVLNNVLGTNPKLFETQIALANATGPVTNIVVQYLQAPSGNATTFFVAVSGIQVRPPALALTCPANQTVNYGSMPPAARGAADFMAQGGAIADNCDTNPSVGSVDSASGSCPIIVARAYTVRDSVGNSASCQQIFTVKNFFAADAIVWQAPLARSGTQVFELGRTIPVQVAVKGCGGIDVTGDANVIGQVEVLGDLNCDGVADTPALPITFHGVGGTDGLMEKVGGRLKYNLNTGSLPRSMRCFVLKVTVTDTSTGETKAETVRLEGR